MVPCEERAGRARGCAAGYSWIEHVARAGHPQREFVVSDDRSPGDGTLPQRVSPEERARVLAALAEALRVAELPPLESVTRGPLDAQPPRANTTLLPGPEGVEVRSSGRLLARVPSRALLLLFESCSLGRHLHVALRRDGGWICGRHVYVAAHTPRAWARAVVS